MEGKEEEQLTWLPEAFRDKVGERGLVIAGWVPQVVILRQEAVGGFVTHCGWNSCLEAISAGVPMVTWPLFAEQSFNEMLVVDVLRIGVPVGEHRLEFWPEKRGVVDAGMIKEAIGWLMGDEEVAERRGRAKELAEKAREAVEAGGSSNADLEGVISDLQRGK